MKLHRGKYIFYLLLSTVTECVVSLKLVFFWFFVVFFFPPEEQLKLLQKRYFQCSVIRSLKVKVGLLGLIIKLS